MNKLLKNGLIISASVLMLLSTGVGISQVNAKSKSSISTQIIYLRNKRSNFQRRANSYNHKIKQINAQITKLENHQTTKKWHVGMPKVFRKRAYWIGSFLYQKHSDRNDRYIRHRMPLDNKAGVSFSPIEYNTYHHVTGGGAGSSYAYINPHYESLGHGWYRVASGSMNKNSLNQELNNTFVDGNAGSVELLHMHGRNHFSMWKYSNDDNQPYYKAHKIYMGYFTRYNNDKIANKALGLSNKDFD